MAARVRGCVHPHEIMLGGLWMYRDGILDKYCKLLSTILQFSIGNEINIANCFQPCILKFTIGNDVSCVTGKESGHLDVEAW
jgi:hypothetical protein